MVKGFMAHFFFLSLFQICSKLEHQIQSRTGRRHASYLGQTGRLDFTQRPMVQASTQI